MSRWDDRQRDLAERDFYRPNPISMCVDGDDASPRRPVLSLGPLGG
jgi:hypothetical protein